MYEQISETEVIRVGSSTAIPVKGDSRETRIYKAWLTQGNSPIPIDTVEKQKTAIRKKAERDIYDIIPRNMISRVQARRTELAILEMRGTITPDQIAEADAIDIKWAQMKAIRIAEEQAVAAL